MANAGVAHYGPFREQDVETAERMTAGQLAGHRVPGGRRACPTCSIAPTGHVVIVSSGAGHRSFPWAAVYGATKAAQRGFAEALRHELAAPASG